MDAPSSQLPSYTAHGPPDGSPIVLLHGFPLDGTMWRHQVGPLAAARHRVIVPDLPGFGRTPPLRSGTPAWGVAQTAGPYPAPFGVDASTHAVAEADAASMDGMADADAASMDGMADAVAALTAHLGIQQAAIAGFSMGGYVALALAARHPRLVKCLLLIDTRPEPDSAQGRAKRLETLQKVRAHGVQPLVEAMLPGMLTTQTWAQRRGLVEEVRGMMMRQGRDGVLAALWGMADRPDRRPLLPSLAVPALVVVGAEDNITPVAAATSMQEALPRARILVIPAAAHLVPMEQPEALNREVLAFLAEAN